MYSKIEINDSVDGRCSIKLDGEEISNHVTSYKIERGVNEIAQVTLTLPVKEVAVNEVAEIKYKLPRKVKKKNKRVNHSAKMNNSKGKTIHIMLDGEEIYTYQYPSNEEIIEFVRKMFIEAYQKAIDDTTSK